MTDKQLLLHILETLWVGAFQCEHASYSTVAASQLDDVALASSKLLDLFDSHIDETGQLVDNYA